MTIALKFNIGDSVALITDADKKQRIVYGIIVYKNDVLYRLSCESQNNDHYDFEIERYVKQKTEVSGFAHKNH